MPASNEQYDVIIIGAGPAGCATALAFREANLTVALLDKKKFPRDKTCGDAIPGPAIKVLKKLLDGVDEVQNFERRQAIDTAKIYTEKGRVIQINWKQEAYNSPRLSFDDYLLQVVRRHTAVHIFEGTEAEQVKFENDNYTVVIKDGVPFKAKFLVGCDGAHSIVRRQLQKDESLKNSGVAVRAYYKNISTPENCNEFFTINEKGLSGYFWIFPLGNGLFNVGIGLSPLSNTKTDLKAAFKSIIEQHPILRERFKDAVSCSPVSGFRLPFGGGRLAATGDQFMLAGDAASLVDPLQGHGIHTAMQSGLLAAQQLIKCFQSGDFSKETLGGYEMQLNKLIRKELKRNIQIMKWLHAAPWLIEASAVLAKNKWVKEGMQKIF